MGGGLWRCDPTRVMASSFLRVLDHTQRRTTVGRTPLDEWSARRRDLYLTTHDTHNIQTSMPPVEFEPTISAGERPQTYALDRAATGTGNSYPVIDKITRNFCNCSFISTSVSGSRRKHLDSLKSRIKLPQIARTGTVRCSVLWCALCRRMSYTGLAF